MAYLPSTCVEYHIDFVSDAHSTKACWTQKRIQFNDQQGVWYTREPWIYVISISHSNVIWNTTNPSSNTNIYTQLQCNQLPHMLLYAWHWFNINYRLTWKSHCGDNFDGLMQDCNNSIHNTLGLLQFCAMPSVGPYGRLVSTMESSILVRRYLWTA